MLTCLLGADPPSKNKASLESCAEFKQERKKKKKKNRKEKSLHKTLERAEGYSEIIHMGASRGEARGLKWGFASHIIPE